VGAAGAFRRRLCRALRPDFDGPGGGSACDGQSGNARQTQGASLVPGAIAGLVQSEGDWLGRSSQPYAMECSAWVGVGVVVVVIRCLAEVVA
jgi:hypothetical protein